MAVAREAVEIATEAAVDKTGWRIFNGKVLLCQASKKYQKKVTLHAGGSIPFNETASWYDPGGQDHWFEVGPLSTPAVEEETGQYIPGRLFTTRMPQGLDEQPGDYKGQVDTSKYTHKRNFIQQVKDNQIKCAIVLVEDEEMRRGKSSALLDFYKSLGIEVHHTPIADFTTPSFELEAKNIETLNTNLAKGVNCLVHCWGGSGRTGTVVIGAISNFGIVRPIQFARMAKSVYLDIKEQEDFVSKQRLVFNEKMLKECPAMVHDLILGHINNLCSNLDDPSLSYVSAEGVVDDAGPVHRALLTVFSSIDVHGQQGIVSVYDKCQFVEKVKATLKEGTFGHITESNLQKLYGRFDAKILACAVDEDSITFEAFVKIMNTNIVCAGDAEANLKKDSGF